MLRRSFLDRNVIHGFRAASVAAAGILAAALVGGSALQGSSARLNTPQVSAPASQTIEGALLDKDCSFKAELRVMSPPRLMEGGMVVAEAHTRQCLTMPECIRNGYGIYTRDNKFYNFDEAGNRRALALVRASKQEDDFEIKVTGQIQGDTIKVESIRLE
jgi:hypothetical protein